MNRILFLPMLLIFIFIFMRGLLKFLLHIVVFFFAVDAVRVVTSTIIILYKSWQRCLSPAICSQHTCTHVLVANVVCVLPLLLPCSISLEEGVMVLFEKTVNF